MAFVVIGDYLKSPRSLSDSVRTKRRLKGLAWLSALLVVISAQAAPVVTNTDDSGPGSLRQALSDAQDGDTITFSFNGDGPFDISLTDGPLIVAKNVVISGPGSNVVTISRDQSTATTTIFYLAPGHVVTIEAVSINNGGIGIYNDGGNGNANLMVRNCVFRGNSIGIFSNGGDGNTAVTMSNCAFDANGTGLFNDGEQGTANFGTSSCTFSASSNHAIFNDGSSGNANLTVDNSTFSGNSAGSGGAIFNDGEQGAATLAINNSTFSSNTASNGAAIFNDVATLIIANSTFHQNAAQFGGATVFNVGGACDIGSSILSAAEGPNITNVSNGTVTSHGYNLSSDDGGGFLAGLGDQINANPLLGPLQNNGGATLTHAPLGDSPAIDKGRRNAIISLSTNVDQRGFARPRRHDNAIVQPPGGDSSDIGAVELGSAPTVLSIHAVSPTASPCPILNIRDTIDAPLELVANEALLSSDQSSLTGGLVADGVTPLLIELDLDTTPTQPTTFTLSTTVTGGGRLTSGPLDGKLRVLQEVNGKAQFVAGNSVVLSSAHVSGFAYIGGIQSEDVQFDTGNNELNITVTATREGQGIPAATVLFRIRKPPIVLVHGYNSDNSAWYAGGGAFLDALTNTCPLDFVLPVQYGVDLTNSDPTATNRNAPFDLLAALLDVQLRTQVEDQQSYWHQQWAFTRYNIVGHSQGGVLARMLCTDDNPAWGDYPDFKPFRSPSNALRGRFDRVITLNAPHWGSTFDYYELRLANDGNCFPTQRRFLEDGTLQEKFNPFGQQITTINKSNWHTDLAARFHLVGTTIYGGNAPPLFQQSLSGPRLPEIYLTGELCTKVAHQVYSAGSIVLPNGSDGIVDLASEFAGNTPGASLSMTRVSGVDIAHCAIKELFGFYTQRQLFALQNDSDVVPESGAIGVIVAELLQGASSSFAPFALQPLPTDLKSTIDQVVPPCSANPLAIQPDNDNNVTSVRPNKLKRATQGKRPAKLRVVPHTAQTYNYHLVPSNGEDVDSVPIWRVQNYGPDGLALDGISATPNDTDPTRVSVSVDDSVIGDVVLSVSYMDIGGTLINGGPVLVVSHPAGPNIVAIELLPEATSLPSGSVVRSDVWADYDNGTRSQMYIPNGAASYSSDDDSIANVDANGQIFLNSLGSTNIYVSYLDFSAQSAVSVTAQPPPPVINALYAVSRKMHGNAGTFDIDLPLSGNPGIEPRAGGAAGDYQVVVTFASPITLNNASVATGAGGVSNIAVKGSEVTVNLTGVSGAQTLLITLTGVSNGTTTGNVSVPMSVLVGDVNGDGFVLSGDYTAVRQESGTPVDGNTFKFDVNADGFILSGDYTTVRQRSGMHLP